MILIQNSKYCNLSMWCAIESGGLQIFFIFDLFRQKISIFTTFTIISFYKLMNNVSFISKYHKVTNIAQKNFRPRKFFLLSAWLGYLILAIFSVFQEKNSI